MHASCDSMKYSTPKTVEILLKNGADPNLKDKNGKTALMHAVVMLGTEKTVNLLLEYGADPNLKDNEGYTALMHASCYIKREKMIIILLKYGADPNLQNNDGETALMLVLLCTGNNNTRNIAKILCKIVNNHGKNVKDIAWEKSQLVYNFLVEWKLKKEIKLLKNAIEEIKYSPALTVSHFFI